MTDEKALLTRIAMALEDADDEIGYGKLALAVLQIIIDAQAPLLAQLADERRKSEALAQHLANVLDTGHSYESEGMARDHATKALAAYRSTKP